VAGLRIVVGSQNQGKVREIKELLEGLEIEVQSLAECPEVELVEETGSSFAENAELKATGFARQLGVWVLADDSGLEVDALDGRPGVFSARYGGEGLTDAQRAVRLLEELRDVPDEDRTARFRCVAALADPNRLLCVTEGSVEGRIAHAPAGSSGFGYDPVFIPKGYDQTFAELGLEIKQRLSHRARALEELRDYLTEILPAERL